MSLPVKPDGWTNLITGMGGYRPDTATGEELDRLVALSGVHRMNSTDAELRVRLSRVQVQVPRTLTLAQPLISKPIKSYDPSQIKVSFGGVELKGFAEGGFVEVRRDEVNRNELMRMHEEDLLEKIKFLEDDMAREVFRALTDTVKIPYPDAFSFALTAREWAQGWTYAADAKAGEIVEIQLDGIAPVLPPATIIVKGNLL